MRLLALVVLVGCGASYEGPVHVEQHLGPIVARSTAAEHGGIHVLSQRPVGRDAQRGLLAESTSQLADLWTSVGLVGVPPAVDFTTHVVIGTSYAGGRCEPKPVAAVIDASGTLTFEVQSVAERCVLVMEYPTRVVAIPRKLVGARFMWKVSSLEGYAFDLSTPSTSPNAQRGRRTIPEPVARVALPTLGHIALRTVEEGRQVWVANYAPDDIAVLDAEVRVEENVLSRVSWENAAHRFASGHDAHGNSEIGTLAERQHERVGDELLLGPPGPSYARGPKRPASTPSPDLILDDSATPYDMPPTELAAISDDAIGVLDADMVITRDGPPRFCHVPRDPVERSHFAGCPATAPELFATLTRKRDEIEMIPGPLAVLHHGNTIKLVIALGDGQREGWTLAK